MLLIISWCHRSGGQYPAHHCSAMWEQFRVQRRVRRAITGKPILLRSNRGPLLMHPAAPDSGGMVARDAGVRLVAARQAGNRVRHIRQLQHNLRRKCASCNRSLSHADSDPRPSVCSDGMSPIRCWKSCSLINPRPRPSRSSIASGGSPDNAAISAVERPSL